MYTCMFVYISVGIFLLFSFGNLILPSLFHAEFSAFRTGVGDIACARVMRQLIGTATAGIEQLSTKIHNVKKTLPP